MNTSGVAAILVLGTLICSSNSALADALGNCGSGVSAPAQPGAANESEPRNCDEASGYETATPPPMPEPQPPAEVVLPQPAEPLEPPPEMPQPQ